MQKETSLLTNEWTIPKCLYFFAWELGSQHLYLDLISLINSFFLLYIRTAVQIALFKYERKNTNMYK